MPHRTFDHIELRCPRLGGPVTFGYCRQAGQDNLPCAKALTCFRLRFPVEEYFRAVLREETFARIFDQPMEGRVERLFRVVDEARDQVEGD